MSYKAIGQELPNLYGFTVGADGVRTFDELSLFAVCSELSLMHLEPQVPTVDGYGVHLVLTPGAPAPGSLSGWQAVSAGAMGGQVVLVSASFTPLESQSILFTSRSDLMTYLTDPSGGNYAVVLSPNTTQQVAGSSSFVDSGLTLPDVSQVPGLLAQLGLPAAPVPLPTPTPSGGGAAPKPAGTPAPPAAKPEAPKGGLFGMTQTQAILAGGAALLLVGLLLMAGRRS